MDKINPDYYKSGGFETIDIINAYTDDLHGIYAVCTANVLKYICRWHKKNGLEDLKKARWYLNYMIKTLEKNPDVDDEHKKVLYKNDEDFIFV